MRLLPYAYRRQRVLEQIRTELANGVEVGGLVVTAEAANRLWSFPVPETGAQVGAVLVNFYIGCRRLARNILDSLPLSLGSYLQAMHYSRLLRRMDSKAPDLLVAQVLAKPRSTVVDVGANVGVYTRWLSEFVGASGRVIAIEPLAETFAILRRIASRFDWSNVTLVAAAASDRSGVLRMRVPVDGRGIRSHYLAHVADNAENAHSVRALTMDELLGTTPVVFIKIDVEDHELPCLQGGLETIRRCRPALLVEINHDRWGQVPGGAAVVELLRKEGYGVWQFDGSRLKQWNGSANGVNYWFLRSSHVAEIQARHPGLAAADSIRDGS